MSQTQTKPLSSVPAISSLAEGDKITVVTAAGQTALVSLSNLLGAVKVGGRNLLKGSNVELSKTGSLEIGYYTYAQGKQPEKDEDLTLTVCYSLNGPGIRVNLLGGDLYAPYTFGKGGSRIVETFNLKQTHDTSIQYGTMRFYRMAGAPTTDPATIHWAVLTKGKNVGVSDWTPAPEDLNWGG